MKKLILILILFFSSLSCFSEEKIYKGTLIDSHSQVGILISNKEVSERINNTDVDLTLLSMRGKYENATKRFQSIQKLTNGKVRYLIPTKLKGFARKKRNANEAINGIKSLK